MNPVTAVARDILIALRPFAYFVIWYFMAVNLANTTLLAAATRSMRRHLLTAASERRWLLLGSPVVPRVSILAPAHNEEATVVGSVTSLLTLSYPLLEIIVVNDGSSDATMDRLKTAFALEPIPVVFRRQAQTATVVGVWRSRTEPDLVVVDKLNGGKADALNAALNLSSGVLVCAIDADTLVEQEALLRMVRPFLHHDDCLAAGGTIRPVNAATVRDGRVVRTRTPRTWLAGIQTVEYLRAFLFGRLGWNSLGGNLIISGAFGLFRRDAVLAAGGYLHGTVGEDMELVARLRRNARGGGPGAIRFVPDPVAWTEVPDTRKVLGRQRDRWHRGLADVLWRYRGSIANPRERALGLVVYPYFFLVELLAPVIEALGLLFLVAGLFLGAVNPSFAVAFFLVAYLWGVVLSFWAVLLDGAAFPAGRTRKDDLWMFVWAIAEQFGYRQLTVWWRLRGLWKWARGNTEWGMMTRAGFAPDPNSPAVSAGT